MFWYIQVLKKYADFSGRASRSEYWWFMLFTTLVNIILMVVDSQLGTFNDAAGMGMLGGLYTLLVLLPSIGVQVRRLHDVDRSGWWLLIYLVPIIGFIVIMIFACMKGTSGSNRFGLDPLELDVATEGDALVMPSRQEPELKKVPAVQYLRD